MMKADNGLYINIHEAALKEYPAMDLLVDAAEWIHSHNTTGARCIWQ